MKTKVEQLRVSLDASVQQLKQNLLKEHKGFIKTSRHEGENYGRKNLPGPRDESAIPFLTVICAFYCGLKKEVSSTLNAQVEKVVAINKATLINHRIEEIKGEIESLSITKHELTTEQGRINLPPMAKSYPFYKVILIILGIGECVWTAAAFVGIGDSYIAGAVIGCMIGVSQILSIKKIIPLIKEAPLERKRIYINGAITFFTVLSFLLGLLRYWFAHTGAASDISIWIVNPFLFMAINMLFLGATALIVHSQFPNNAELILINEHNRVSHELAKVNRNMDSLNAERRGLEFQKQDLAEMGALRLSNERILHAMIDDFFQEAFGEFKSENFLKRPDGQFPNCFKGAAPRLPDDVEPLLIQN